MTGSEKGLGKEQAELHFLTLSLHLNLVYLLFALLNLLLLLWAQLLPPHPSTPRNPCSQVEWNSPEERLCSIYQRLSFHCGKAGQVLVNCPFSPKEKAHQPQEGHWWAILLQTPPPREYCSRELCHLTRTEKNKYPLPLLDSAFSSLHKFAIFMK